MAMEALMIFGLEQRGGRELSRGGWWQGRKLKMEEKGREGDWENDSYRVEDTETIKLNRGRPKKRERDVDLLLGKNIEISLTPHPPSLPLSKQD